MSVKIDYSAAKCGVMVMDIVLCTRSAAKKNLKKKTKNINNDFYLRSKIAVLTNFSINHDNQLMTAFASATLCLHTGHFGMVASSSESPLYDDMLFNCRTFH